MKLFNGHSTSTLLSSFILTLFLLTPAMAEEPASTDDPLTDEHAQKIFDLAMEERDDGKVYDAIEKFEYILSRRPSLNRARLELAVSYHRASQYEKALQEFQIVLDDPETPEKVRLAILAYLGQLTSDELKPQYENNFSYYTKAGLMYNTNINFAPLKGDPNYNILSGQNTASPGLDTFLSASHQYRDNKPFDTDGAATLFEWLSQVSWTGNNYTRDSDYSVNIISASTGPAFISTGRWRGAISVQVDQTFFGDSVLGTFVSLNPLLTFDLGDYRGITLEASYMHNDFARSVDLGRDGHSVLAGAAYSTLLGGVDNGIETGFRLTDMTADDAQYGYNSAEIYFGGFIAAGKAGNVYLNLNFEHFDYDAPDSISGMVRDEIESNYMLGYNWDISSGTLAGWTLNTYFSYTNNNSNVEFYDYNRKIIAINLARYFL